MTTEQTLVRDAADPMLPHRYRVVASQVDGQDSMTLTLQPLDVELPDAVPGQFNMVWVPGFGEVAISCSAIPGNGLMVHTVRSVGAVTKALCEMVPGDVVGIRGPFGTGWPVAEAKGRDLVLVAGGIGLAPLRPVLHEVLADRDAFGRVTVVVGARTAHDLLYRAELERWWRDRSIETRMIVDQPCSHWTSGSVGVVTHELRRARLSGAKTTAMVCGPEVMMRLVSAYLVDHGVLPDAIAVSLERNMQCGIGECGHCQLAGKFICKDGPVFDWQSVEPLMEVREL